MQYIPMQYNTVQYNTIHSNAIEMQYNTMTPFLNSNLRL